MEVESFEQLFILLHDRAWRQRNNDVDAFFFTAVMRPQNLVSDLGRIDIERNALLHLPSEKSLPVLGFPRKFFSGYQCTACASTRFFPASDPDMASNGSGSTALPAIFLCEESTPATITCLFVNSQAQSGRGD